MIKTILTFFLMLPCVNAQTLTSYEYTKEIGKELESLKSIKPSEYINQINDHRTKLEKYFEHKKRVCNGEFSTVVLQGAESLDKSKKKGNKLSKEERKLCFREMKAMQMTFLNHMFLARKNYLNYLHNKRLEELSVAREKAIKSLQRSFSKSKVFSRTSN